MQVKVTIITALEREHVAALGGSIESIANAKAGIVHAGGHVVVSQQPLPEARQALMTALAQVQNVKISWARSSALSDDGLYFVGARNSSTLV